MTQKFLRKNRDIYDIYVFTLHLPVPELFRIHRNILWCVRHEDEDERWHVVQFICELNESHTIGFQNSGHIDEYKSMSIDKRFKSQKGWVRFMA